ncbi:MAG: hypothetical protein V4496_03395 [Pseudomonadota bacterium]
MPEIALENIHALMEIGPEQEEIEWSLLQKSNLPLELLKTRWQELKQHPEALQKILSNDAYITPYFCRRILLDDKKSKFVFNRHMISPLAFLLLDEPWVLQAIQENKITPYQILNLTFQRLVELYQNQSINVLCSAFVKHVNGGGASNPVTVDRNYNNFLSIELGQDDNNYFLDTLKDSPQALKILMSIYDLRELVYNECLLTDIHGYLCEKYPVDFSDKKYHSQNNVLINQYRALSKAYGDFFINPSIQALFKQAPELFNSFLALPVFLQDKDLELLTSFICYLTKTDLQPWIEQGKSMEELYDAVVMLQPGELIGWAIYYCIHNEAKKTFKDIQALFDVDKEIEEAMWAQFPEADSLKQQWLAVKATPSEAMIQCLEADDYITPHFCQRTFDEKGLSWSRPYLSPYALVLLNTPKIQQLIENNDITAYQVLTLNIYCLKALAKDGAAGLLRHVLEQCDSRTYPYCVFGTPQEQYYYSVASRLRESEDLKNLVATNKITLKTLLAIDGLAQLQSNRAYPESKGIWGGLYGKLSDAYLDFLKANHILVFLNKKPELLHAFLNVPTFLRGKSIEQLTFLKDFFFEIQHIGFTERSYFAKLAIPFDTLYDHAWAQHQVGGLDCWDAVTKSICTYVFEYIKERWQRLETTHAELSNTTHSASEKLRMTFFHQATALPDQLSFYEVFLRQLYRLRDNIDALYVLDQFVDRALGDKPEALALLSEAVKPYPEMAPLLEVASNLTAPVQATNLKR